MDEKFIRLSFQNGAEEFSRRAVEFLLREIDKYKKANLVTLEGWKGKSGAIIEKRLNDFLVIEYRKNKDDGSIDEQRTEVPSRDVEFIKGLLKILPKKTTYREVVKEIIRLKNLNCDIEAFNGGKFRALYYFRFYYYPIRILEHLKEIKYGGRGTIERLDKNG